MLVETIGDLLRNINGLECVYVWDEEDFFLYTYESLIDAAKDYDSTTDRIIAQWSVDVKTKSAFIIMVVPTPEEE